jgi:hypothetical protein
MTDAPEYLALLPTAAAERHLNDALLRRHEAPPAQVLDDSSRALPRIPRWEAQQLRDLLDEAMRRHSASEAVTGADAWLAPRLHHCLRLTRREASDEDLWNHLAMRVAPDYVFWRHGHDTDRERTTVNRNRFLGAFHTQTFARLWWAAELFRDGYDYAPVKTACSNQDMLHTALRLEIVLHRPSAQAMIQMVRNGSVRTGRQVNALAKAVNATAVTVELDALGPDDTDSMDMDTYRNWVLDAGSDALTPYDRLPDGPDDGKAPRSAVDSLTAFFEELFAETPVRGE